jgi:uncharacterized protein (DUF885 family)
MKASNKQGMAAVLFPPRSPNSLFFSTFLLVLSVLLFCAPAFGQDEEQVSPEREASRVTSLARLYYKNLVKHQPEMAYFMGILPERHDGMLDNSPRSINDFVGYQGWMLRELRTMNPELLQGQVAWITYFYMLEYLTSRSRTHVCQNHLWNINQMGGWHTSYPRLAEMQPVGESVLRQTALIRWKKYPGFIDQEIYNLRLGLRRGYSAPKAVVRRVIGQIDGLLAIPLEDSQLTSPARRDGDEAFSAEFTTLVADEIMPAYARYRDFLENEYMPLAREELSVLKNRDGRACYEASLAAYTTLERTPEEVFELGQQTVAANRERVIELGQAVYGLSDFTAIIDRIKADESDKFSSADELLAFANSTVERANKAMPAWFGSLPKRGAVVEPYPSYQEGTGMSARYEPGDGSRPGVYRIPLYQPETQSRGRVETTAFHEVWPGHHLQVAISQSIPGLHELTQLLWFSGMGEGWGRYSESLAAEAGLYSTQTGPILRLAWPARGMVVDPGIHIFDWTREQAIEFMGEAGRMTEKQLDDMVDRIAILPGQLTAYDSGGLEIVALRALAEAELGEAFDIRSFHDRILENGTLPLTALRRHIESWINNEQARIAAELEAAEAVED